MACRDGFRTACTGACRVTHPAGPARVGLSSAALAAALTSQVEVFAEVPGLLRDATLRAATGGDAVAAGTAALVAEVARNLVAAGAVRAAIVTLTVVSLLSAGAGIAAVGGRAAEPQAKAAPAGGEAVTGIQTAAERVSAVDLFGDPLPKGAIARLGTNRFRHSLLDGANHLSRVFLSRDGASLVTVARQGGVSVWESATGRLVRSIDASDAALAPDGKLLATVRPGSVHIWDLALGRERFRNAHTRRRAAHEPGILGRWIDARRSHRDPERRQGQGSRGRAGRLGYGRAHRTVSPRW